MAYKHDYDKTLTRLVSILSKLYNGDSLSVKELAEEFNVSTRTIQRDFNNRLISFPIYQENKLWKMQDGFRLEKSNTIEDSIVLDIMEKLVEGVGDKFSVKAKTLLSKIRNEEFNPIYTKLNMEDIGDKLKEIQELESAIKSKQEITSIYKVKENMTLNLQIKPLKIVNFEGFWYLIALDVNDKDLLKKYYLKNIQTIKQTDNIFIVNNRLERILKKVSTIWFDETKEPFTVKINVSNDIAKYIKRKPISPSQILDSVNEDGSVVIVLKITHEMEIIPIIKYWLPHMKIIEPTWIDEKIKNDLSSYLLNNI